MSISNRVTNTGVISFMVKVRKQVEITCPVFFERLMVPLIARPKGEFMSTKTPIKLQ
jgi:hypothetical protein